MKQFKFTLLSGFVAAVFVFAGIGALALVARAQGGPTATPTVQTQEKAEPTEAAEDSETTEADEAAKTKEAADPQGQAAISQADAETAALDANPGAKVVKTELDKEDGILAYTVELDNGVDVIVDANTGDILTSEQDKEAKEAAEGAETADNNNDQTQEEHQSQVDDVNETPGVEDAVGQ